MHGPAAAGLDGLAGRAVGCECKALGVGVRLGSTSHHLPNTAAKPLCLGKWCDDDPSRTDTTSVGLSVVAEGDHGQLHAGGVLQRGRSPSRWALRAAFFAFWPL